MRKAEISRKTFETEITLSVDLDGSGSFRGSSGIGFFDHMLHQVARHGGLDLEYHCQGDLQVDNHHTVEDIAICFGKALREALGDKAGIARYGAAYVPMDEALARTVMDFSGRAYLRLEAVLPAERVGSFETENVREFFRAMAEQGGITLHMDVLSGANTHHIIEALFKSFGRALKEAVAVTGSAVVSTKGILE